MEFDRRQMRLLAGAHAAADLCQGAVPALLPFLVHAHGWSYGAASLLVLAATLSSSIVQPAFGHLSDRHPKPWLLPLGLAVGGLGLGAVGLLGDSVPAAFVVVLISGLGVAAFHPEGSRAAAYAAGAERKATGMSWFSVGGNVGWALGPIVVSATVLPFGLAATPLLAVLPLAAALVMARELPAIRAKRAQAQTATRATADDADDWRAFGILTGAVASRSIVYFGLMTFVPLYLVDAGQSHAMGEAAITAFLVGGAVGTLLGGPLADRVGRRPVLVASFCLQLPLLVAFLAAPPAAAVPLLAVIGVIAIATFSISVVLGQSYLPNHLGVASGVTLGLAIGIGGLAASALGALADAHGPKASLELLLVLPVLGLACVLLLPSERRAQLRPATA